MQKNNFNVIYKAGKKFQILDYKIVIIRVCIKCLSLNSTKN